MFFCYWVDVSAVFSRFTKVNKIAALLWVQWDYQLGLQATKSQVNVMHIMCQKSHKDISIVDYYKARYYVSKSQIKITIVDYYKAR